ATVTYQPLPSAVNIYTANGTITDAGATRTVTLNGKTLTFTGTGGAGGGTFSIQNSAVNIGGLQKVSTFDVLASTRIGLSSSSDLNLRSAVAPNPGALRIQTPKVGSATPPTVGNVLTLQNVDGSAEWATAPGAVNIYNTNGSLTTHRTVSGAGLDLTFSGIANGKFESS